MKRTISLLSTLVMAFSLCACGGQTEASELVAVPAGPAYETGEHIGVQNGASIRFDAFGMTVELPESTKDAPVNENPPKTYGELDEILASEFAYFVNWTDFEAQEGSASFHIQIMPCDEGTQGIDVMHYFMDTYPNEPGAVSYEIKNEPIGGRNGTPCFLAAMENEYGSQDERLIFDLVDGTYRIECTVDTYGWKGTEKLAEQIFFVDIPKELPFAFDESGLLLIKDYSIFGKTFDEVKEILPQIADLEKYEYWKPQQMDYTTVSADEYTVTLLFNQEGKLQVVMNEEIGAELYETGFEKARELWNDVYFYNPMEGNAYFVDGGNYFFLTGKPACFVFARCAGENRTILTQRHIALDLANLSYDGLYYTAANILSGRVANMQKEQGMNIAIFAAEQEGSAKAFCDVAALYEEELHDNEKALEWYEKAVEMGDADAMFELGSFYIRTNNDAEAALTMYDKAAKLGQPWAKINIGALYAQMEETEELDYDKAAKGLLEEIDSDDESLAVSAKGWLYALYQKEKDRFSADTRAAADEMFIPVEEAAENGSGEAAGQFGDYYRGMRDYAKALEWYEKGAELGDGHSGLFSGRILMGVFGNDQIKTNLNKAAEYLLAASKAKDETVREEAAVHLVEIWYNYRDTLTPELKEPVQAAAVAKVLADKDLFLPDVVMQAERLAG